MKWTSMREAKVPLQRASTCQPKYLRAPWKSLRQRWASVLKVPLHHEFPKKREKTPNFSS